jgi:hypothetical protein
MEAILCDASPLAADLFDDEEKDNGRILPLGEFIEKVKARSDIFLIDRDSRLSKVEVACIVLAIATGVLVGFIKIEPAIVRAPDYIDPASHAVTVVLSSGTVQVTADHYNTVVPPQVQRRFTLNPKQAVRHQGTGAGGVGSPNARVARENAFRILSARLSAVGVPGVDQGSQITGITHGLDAMLVGIHTLKAGADPESGRRLPVGTGTAPGYGPSGFGPGNGPGIGDPLADLLPQDEGLLVLRPIRHSSTLGNMAALTESAGTKIYAGGRSKSSIMHTVTDNLPALRYAYNRWLRVHPGAAGKITVKFAIDEFGNVIFCEVVNGTLPDKDLSEQVVTIVKTWRFGKIDKPGDITEAVYPLVFSM